LTQLKNLKTLEFTGKIHTTSKSATPVPIGGYHGLVHSAHCMTALARLNLHGHDININSRKSIMKLPRVKEGMLQIMLPPCLVFVGRSVRFAPESIQNYLDAGCCVYHEGYPPVYPEVKYPPGLVSVTGKQGVLIIGKGTAQFNGLDITSHILGECFCPAGCKGYFEMTVDECEQGTASFGFCSKNWVLNVKKSVDQIKATWDKEPWGKENWSVSLDGSTLSDQDDTTPDAQQLSAGSVIGLGCEVYGDAQVKTQPGVHPWETWLASNSTYNSDSKSSAQAQSKDQLLSAEEIYKLEPWVWSSDTVSSSERECRGIIRVWVYNKTSAQTDAVVEHKPVFTIKLTGLDSLDGLCPTFSCNAGTLTCNLGGKGCEPFCHTPQGYEAMGSFHPAPISPNTAGVFTVLHNPTSLPISAPTSVEKTGT
jgi:hypothetical protein